MDIVTVVLCAGLAFTLALLITAHRRLDGLPLRIWSIAKKERAQDEGAAVTALQEATAARVGPAVSSLKAYHEQIAATFRAQVADAQMRARIAERQSSEAGVALRAASELVREARALRDDLAQLVHGTAVPEPAPTTAPAETHGAPVLPPEPGTSGSRKLTVPDAGRAPDADSEDSGAWTHPARPSDADGEHTRVGPRPSPEQPRLAPAPQAAATLVSMRAVELQPKKKGAP
jgi:hypothetical protein